MIQFAGHPQQFDWDEAYLAARSSVEQARNVRVYDFADVRPNIGLGDVALFIRVLRAADHRRRAVFVELASDCARQHTDTGLAIGISPYGTDAIAAAASITATVGSGPPGRARWVTGSMTLEELRELIAKWLLHVVDRRYPPLRSRSSGSDSDAVLADELPSGPDSAQASTIRRFRGMPR